MVDYIGWTLGVIALVFAVIAELRAHKADRKLNEERLRSHSFLKGLKPSLTGCQNQQAVLDAVNDEMARLIPPKTPLDRQR